MKVNTPISCGELIDKLTILKIKKTKIIDEQKLLQINKEFQYLNKTYLEILDKFPNLDDMFNSLYEINLKLWDIEDKIRICEKNKKFDKEFIDLARNVYICNDSRFEIKNIINEYLNSDVKEQKSYENY
jgi:hypothetical protein